jgi:hypothetical protein
MNAINGVDAGRAFDEEYDGEDDGGESPSGSEQSGHSGGSDGSDGMEKKAAWLLMNLSVRDGAWGAASADTGPGPGPGAGHGHGAAGAIGAGIGIGIGGREIRPQLTVEIPFDFAPRVKRRRATSL